MSTEVKGKIIEIGATETLGAKGFRKRLLVIETDDKYPQQLPLEFTQDKVDMLNPFQVGQAVKVAINLNGRAWTNPQGVVKYFPSFSGWRIEAEDSAPSAPAPVETSNEPDDLPF